MKKRIKINKLGENSQQSDKFVQTAKEYGCDESEKAFSEKLKELAQKKAEG